MLRLNYIWSRLSKLHQYIIKHLLLTVKFLLLLFPLLCSYCFAQETVERDRKLSPQVTEKYNVLKSDYTVLQGQYSAYLKKKLLAAGKYEKNKRTGVWTFFNKQGTPCQRFNYDSNSLVFESGPDSTIKILYMVDDSLKNNPRFTRPIRVGGLYYGFLPYANLVRLPKDYWELNNEMSSVTMEILVSPYGRLAEFKLRIRPYNAPFSDNDAVFNFNINLLDADDKVFVPATLNKEPISVRMIIPCRFNGVDRIELL